MEKDGFERMVERIERGEWNTPECVKKVGKLGVYKLPGKPKIKENCQYKIFDVARSKILDKVGVYVIRTDRLDAVWFGETGDIPDRMGSHIHHYDSSNLIWELAHSIHFPEYRDDPDRLKKEVKSFFVEFVLVEGGRERRRAVEKFVYNQLRQHSPRLLNRQWVD